MYYLANFCCICMKQEQNLRYLDRSENNTTSTYSKLNFFIPQLLNEYSLKTQAQICSECCEHVDNVYMFREQCIKNINLFKNYVGKLQFSNEVGYELSVPLCDPIEENIIANFVIKSEENYEDEKEENVYSSVDSNGFENVKVEYELLDNPLENCDFELKMNTSFDADEQNLIDNQNGSQTLESSWETDHSTEFRLPESYYDTSETVENISVLPQYDHNINNINGLTQFKENISNSQMPNNEANFMCNICNKFFKKKKSLKKHLKLHKKINPVNLPDEYNCNLEEICKVLRQKYMPNNESQLNQCDNDSHVYKLNSHNLYVQLQKYQCTICNKIYSSEFRLLCHNYVHAGFKAKKCKVCKKTFFTKYSLREHKKLHKKQNMFKCKNCLKTFKYACTLKIHFCPMYIVQ